MKKLLYIALFLLLLLTGCEKKSAKIPTADLFLLSDNTTADGVRPGDTSEKFIEIYGEYSIQAAFNHTASSYISMSVKKIPFNEDISTLISCFFIDGKPLSETMICEIYDVTPSQMHDLISSSDFLRSHEVEYRYLRFKWSDGIITEILSSDLNYNETYEIPCIE
jgi:hypothetical protein